MNNRNLKKLLQALAVLLCAVVLVVPHVSVYATTTVEEIKVEDLQKETSDLESQLSDLNSEMESLSSEIQELASQIKEIDEETEIAQLDLAAAKLSQESQYEAAKKRIQYMYENGNSSLLELIFSAESMSEFLNNSEFVSVITEYDREMLESLQEVTDTVSAKEQELSEKQNSLATAKEELEAKQSTLSSKIETVQNDLTASTEQLNAAKAAQTAATDAQSSVVLIPGSAVTSSESEIALFAAILHCEALQDDYDALLAVATVIMNRVESSNYPNTIREVIYQKGQFSPVSSGKLDRILAQGPTALCYTVAKDALAGARLEKVQNCLSFRMIGTSYSGILVGDNVFF